VFAIDIKLDPTWQVNPGLRALGEFQMVSLWILGFIYFFIAYIPWNVSWNTHTYITCFFNFSQVDLEPDPLIESTHELGLIVMVSALARSYRHYYYYSCFCYLNLKKNIRSSITGILLYNLLFLDMYWGLFNMPSTSIEYVCIIIII